MYTVFLVNNWMEVFSSNTLVDCIEKARATGLDCVVHNGRQELIADYSPVTGVHIHTRALEIYIKERAKQDIIMLIRAHAAKYADTGEDFVQGLNIGFETAIEVVASYKVEN